MTGGGTGGHISPIVAVTQELRSRPLDIELIWVGSSTGLEADAAADLDIPFHSVAVGKLRRYFSAQTIPDGGRVPLGVVQSVVLLRKLRPSVIFSTGGYAGVPAVVAGRILGIPSITHEQTAVLGLATKINARFCDTVALSHASTPHPKTRRSARIVVTGNPVRSSLSNGDPQEAAGLFDLAADRPLLYITGGAQGAKAINDAVSGCLEALLEIVEIIHQTGPDQFNGSYSRLVHQRGLIQQQLSARYHPVERVGPELAGIYASAALVLSRSGAGTVGELAGAGLPSILVPLPGAREQLANAQVLASDGGAVIIEQSDLSARRLVSEIQSLINDVPRRARMGKQARLHAAPQAASLLADEIIGVARSPK